MAKKTDEVKDDRPVSREEFNNLEAFVRILNDRIDRHSANFKELVKRIYDDACGGKVGFTRGQHLVSAAVVSILLCIGIAKAADLWVLYKSDATYGTCYVSATGGAATLTVDNVAASLSGAVAATTLSASGKATMNGELEANGIVDVNSGLPAHLITFDNTDTTGAASTAWIKITDARTGTYANEPTEASLAIGASGTYALYVSSGSTALQALDCDSITVDAGAGVDAAEAGALQFGIATATSTDIGKTACMTTIKGTLNVDEAVTLDSTVTATGKATANGELEANSLVDINLTLPAHNVTIVNTDTTGTASTAMCQLTDARTGANANEATEATLAIGAAGTFALYVSAGASEFQAVDCDSITVDAGAGIDAQEAGALGVGAATATSINYGSVAVTAHTFASDGTGTAEVVLPEGSIDSTEILNATIVDADVSATAAIAQSKLACSGIGTVVAAAASATETADGLVVTVITFSNVVMVATDGSAEGESVQVFDFDAGAFTILSAVLNATCTVSAGANTGNHYVSLGTVAAADDDDLTDTEADVIPKTTLTENGALAADKVLAATIVMDGTATTKDLYFNWAVPDASMNADVTNTVTGTLTLITTKAVDNQ